MSIPPNKGPSQAADESELAKLRGELVEAYSKHHDEALYKVNPFSITIAPGVKWTEQAAKEGLKTAHVAEEVGVSAQPAVQEFFHVIENGKKYVYKVSDALSYIRVNDNEHAGDARADQVVRVHNLIFNHAQAVSHFKEMSAKSALAEFTEMQGNYKKCVAKVKEFVDSLKLPVTDEKTLRKPLDKLKLDITKTRSEEDFIRLINNAQLTLEVYSRALSEKRAKTEDHIDMDEQFAKLMEAPTAKRGRRLTVSSESYGNLEGYEKEKLKKEVAKKTEAAVPEVDLFPYKHEMERVDKLQKAIFITKHVFLLQEIAKDDKVVIECLDSVATDNAPEILFAAYRILEQRNERDISSFTEDERQVYSYETEVLRDRLIEVVSKLSPTAGQTVMENYLVAFNRKTVEQPNAANIAIDLKRTISFYLVKVFVLGAFANSKSKTLVVYDEPLKVAAQLPKAPKFPVLSRELFDETQKKVQSLQTQAESAWEKARRIVAAGQVEATQHRNPVTNQSLWDELLAQDLFKTLFEFYEANKKEAKVVKLARN